MKITYFKLGFDKLIVRFYLLMAVVIVPFMIGAPLIALLACPLFISCMLGINITFNKNPKATLVNLHGMEELMRRKRA